MALPVALIAPQASVAAQTASTSGITGTVLDPRGAPLPGANIVVRNGATGNVAQRLNSDSQGKYSVTGLAPGKYTVQVDASRSEEHTSELQSPC